MIINKSTHVMNKVVRLACLTTVLPLAISGTALFADQPTPCNATCISHLADEHPFLDQTYPVAWSRLTPNCIVPDTQEAIRWANNQLERIAGLKTDEMTYDNTFGAYDRALTRVNEVDNKIGLISSLCNSDAVRKAVDRVTPEFAAFFSSISKNQALYRALKTAAAQLQGDNSLSQERRRMMTVALAFFRDGGAALPDNARKKLEQLDRDIAQATQQFANILLDCHAAWNFETTQADDLKGISKIGIARAAKQYEQAHPGKKGWRFTWHDLSTENVMTKADSEDFRRKIWEKTSTAYTGPFDTEPLIRKILKLRQEKARLMGYQTYPDMALKDSMAGSGKKGLEFVDGLIAGVKPKYLADMEDLRQYKAKKTGRAEASLYPWDTAYWSARQKEELYHYSEETIRPYLTLDSALAGLFDVADRLFNINVIEKKTQYIVPGSGTPLKDGYVEVWHPQVRFFEVWDKATSKHIGSFYLDMFMRSTKRNGGWMSIITLGQSKTAHGVPARPHLGMIGVNFPQPAPGEPALLRPGNVQTLFHEFGHILHLMFSETESGQLAGTNVPLDFVELPSQLMVNWLWESSFFKDKARHYKTGEALPESLLNVMKDVKKYHQASGFMRQLMLGKMDLTVHTNPALLDNTSLNQLNRNVLGDLLYFKEPLPSVIRSSHHLFSSAVGYSSFYFSYKWAEILEADAFSRFQKEGIFNREIAQSFRDNILSRGYSEQPAVLFRNFMGRDPNPEALMIKYGITTKQQ